MKKYFFGTALIMFLLSITTSDLQAQCIFNGEKWVVAGTNEPCQNAIITAVPFLRIAPDARASAVGDAGIALSADANSIAFNDSKLVFSEDDLEFSASYTPWFRNINLTDMYIAYLSGYKRLDDLQAVGGHIRFFSFGNIQFTDENGNPTGQGNPQEAEIKLSYARKLSDNLGFGIGGKFIYSDLASNQSVNGQVISVGLAGAVDLSATYNNEVSIGDTDADLTIGLAATNIGSKITYLNASNDNRDFLPANLGLGTALNFELDGYNQLAILADFNKLLVPTNCFDNCDEDGNGIPDQLEYNPIQAMFTSFGDAPNGFSEEIAEITASLGLEYWYNNQFALRGGYFHESPSKGNRKYATVGTGLKYNVFEINLSYLIAINQNNSPLAGTMRFSFLFNLGEE